MFFGREGVGNNSLIALSIRVTPKRLKLPSGEKIHLTTFGKFFTPLGSFYIFRSHTLLLAIRVYCHDEIVRLSN